MLTKIHVNFWANSSVQTVEQPQGPPHACDFADIFMGALDVKVTDELEERGIENTGWTIYRDDGWVVALNGIEDVPVI